LAVVVMVVVEVVVSSDEGGGVIVSKVKARRTRAHTRRHRQVQKATDKAKKRFLG
jgi:hypothetical protein